MVKAIGDNISMGEYNGLVYLLRKFKKIVRHETIDKTLLETDIGTLNISSGLINVGDNFILEDDVKIKSQNSMPLTTYYFTFYIVEINTSEEISEVPVTLSADTDKQGNLEITIPENILDDGEEIKRDFKIEVTFQEHEGISPLRTINLSLTTDKSYIGADETATITATITDTDDDPISGYSVNFNVNGTITSKTTDSTGKATLTITGDGTQGLLNIKVLNKEINILDYYFYDKATSSSHNINYWYSTWLINYREDATTIKVCKKGGANFCPAISPTQTDITKRLEFDTPYAMEFDIYDYYSNNVNLRVWDGNESPWTVYFNHTIIQPGHYKLLVEEDVIQLWVDDVLIEETVNVLDDTSVSFVSNKTNDNTCKSLDFANLIIYNLSTPEPPAHDYSLSVVGTSIIQTGDNTTVTATLTDNGVAVEGETLDYEIKHGSTVLGSGTTSATDSNGQATISYTGTGVGDVDVIVSKSSMSLQETFVIEDCIKTWLNTYSSTQSINYNLPSSFKIEFIINAGANTGSNNTAFLRFNNNNGLFVGKASSNTLTLYLGGSDTIPNILPVGSDAECLLTYENGSATLSYGEDSITVNNLSLTSLYEFGASTNSKIKNVKVKAL